MMSKTNLNFIIDYNILINLKNEMNTSVSIEAALDSSPW